MSVSILDAYLGVLAGRRRRAVVCAGLMARLYRSMASLGTVLLVAQHSGSYTLAGAVAGAGVVGVGLAGPGWSRYADTRGEPAVLPANLVATAASLVALVLVVTLGAPTWTWFAASLALGASSLDFGALVRARWANLLSEATQRHTALGLESVIDELSYVIGPALVAGLAATLGAQWALVVALVTVLAGGSGLLALRDDAPPARPRRKTPSGEARPPLLPSAVLPLSGIYLGVGLLFTSVDISSVATAEANGVAGLAGLIVACFAAGSVVSGFLFGPLSASWGVVRRLLVACLSFAVMVQLLLLVQDVPLLPLVGFLVGMTTSPVLISAMSYIEHGTERHRLTEAMSWPSVAISLGITVGSVITGMTIDAHGALRGFSVASAGGVIVAATALGVARATRRQRLLSV